MVHNLSCGLRHLHDASTYHVPTNNVQHQIDQRNPLVILAVRHTFWIIIFSLRRTKDLSFQVANFARKTIQRLHEGYMINLCINKQIYKHWMNVMFHWQMAESKKRAICNENEIDTQKIGINSKISHSLDMKNSCAAFCQCGRRFNTHCVLSIKHTLATWLFPFGATFC